MSEPTSEIPQDFDILPLTKESAEIALSEIAADPMKAVVEEGALIQANNPHLNLLLHTRIKVGIKNQFDFIEGALFTHKILRTQAERGGGKLPVISPDLQHTYLVDAVDRVSNRPSLSISQDWSEQIVSLRTEEPELGKVLEEITRYRPNKEDFNFGATEVYFIIRKALISKRLGKEFKLDI